MSFNPCILRSCATCELVCSAAINAAIWILPVVFFGAKIACSWPSRLSHSPLTVRSIFGIKLSLSIVQIFVTLPSTADNSTNSERFLCNSNLSSVSSIPIGIIPSIASGRIHHASSRIIFARGCTRVEFTPN